VNAETQLQDALQEWQRLAEAEGEAIRVSNWALVAECQKALRDLRPKLNEFTRTAREEWASLGAQARSKQDALRLALGGLIEIESRNYARLTALRQSAESRLEQLESASRTLRQVRRSYSSAAPAAWTSFS
jgi:hypothetical protein